MDGLTIFFLFILFVFFILAIIVMILVISLANFYSTTTQQLTNVNSVTYSAINYPLSVPNTDYTIDTARFCVACSMSSTNSYNNANILLPSYLSSKGISQGLLLTPVQAGVIPFEAVFAYPDYPGDTLSIEPLGPWEYNTFMNVGNIHSGISKLASLAYNDVPTNIGGKNNILFTGHGVGAAVAYVCATSLKKTNPSLNIFAYTSALPLIGDKEWMDNSQLPHNAVLNNEVDNVCRLVLPAMDNVTQTYAAYVEKLEKEVTFIYNTGNVNNNHNLLTYEFILNTSMSRPFNSVWTLVTPVF